MNTRNLLNYAADEIRHLRQRNTVLEAKVETMHLMANLFYAAAPSQNGAMAPDVLWEIEKALKESEPELSANVEFSGKPACGRSAGTKSSTAQGVSDDDSIY